MVQQHPEVRQLTWEEVLGFFWGRFRSYRNPRGPRWINGAIKGSGSNKSLGNYTPITQNLSTIHSCSWTCGITQGRGWEDTLRRGRLWQLPLRRGKRLHYCVCR